MALLKLSLKLHTPIRASPQNYKKLSRYSEWQCPLHTLNLIVGESLCNTVTGTLIGLGVLAVAIFQVNKYGQWLLLRHTGN